MYTLGHPQNRRGGGGLSANGTQPVALDGATWVQIRGSLVVVCRAKRCSGTATGRQLVSPTASALQHTRSVPGMDCSRKR